MDTPIEGQGAGSIINRLVLPPEKLRRRVDPATLPFQTTADVPPLEATIGQPRGIEAIEFGLQVKTPGYNLYVGGTSGSGRTSTVNWYLDRLAQSRPIPNDWVYVHNFRDADEPRAIELPSGRGTQLSRDLENLVRAVQREIPRVFGGEDYAHRRQAALAGITQRREALLSDLQAYALERGFGLDFTPTGIVSAPLIDGRPLTTEEYQRLDAQQRQEIDHHGEEVQERVGPALRELRQIVGDAEELIRKLDRDVALFTVGPLFEPVREHNRDLAEVQVYLAEVQEDLVDRLDDFRSPSPSGGPEVASDGPMDARRGAPGLSRYRVNVFIAHVSPKGAPVVVERNPTYYNLIGRVDYRPAFGAVVTDFMQIKPGALHRANGGYLVLPALDLLRNPFAWDALKRALLAREIRIENLGEQYSTVPVATLRPESIPLDVKVILIGPTLLYHALHEADEDFSELFNVKVDFASDMEWSDENLRGFVGFISRCVRDSGLRHFDRAAVARIAECGARQLDDQRKLPTRLLDVSTLLTEASFWAGQSGREIVQVDDVDLAIHKREFRSNLPEQRLRDAIADGTLQIDTTGKRVGQVNGLSVVDVGDHEFGVPSRVSARVALGRGNVVSIDREAELSGPIHSKGFFILNGYLAGQYAQDWPLSLGATITFEQSYGGVEGDSASSTELYALLSAISGVPIKQSLAVTGSINQYGEVQAVGGVTNKIEGFFATCKARGLTGDQGVIIPGSNVHNLMLDPEIVEAARAGLFHIWAINTVDEGIELLTGQPVGTRGADGQFAEGTIHRLVADHLRHFAEESHAFAVHANGREGSSRVPAAKPPPGTPQPR